MFFFKFLHLCFYNYGLYHLVHLDSSFSADAAYSYDCYIKSDDGVINSLATDPVRQKTQSTL